MPGYQPGRVPQVPVCPFSILSLSYIPSAPICCFSLARLRRTLFIDDTWKAKDRKGNGSAVARSPPATRATPAPLPRCERLLDLGASQGLPERRLRAAAAPTRSLLVVVQTNKQTNQGERKKKQAPNPTLQNHSDSFD